MATCIVKGLDVGGGPLVVDTAADVVEEAEEAMVADDSGLLI